MHTAASPTASKSFHLLLLVLLSGLGGLVAGVDYGIISVALLYLDKTIPMTPAEQGFMVSIYVFGGVIASLLAGSSADMLGRKKMLIASGVMFVASILLIYMAQGYVSLLVGRVLMGLSGGFVCVVVPLYMAECLPSEFRGRGTAAFQLLMTVGFFLSTVIGNHFAKVHEAAIKLADGNPDLIFAADNDAWRNIFLTAVVPGALFVVLALVAKESPRWLFRRKRGAEAAAVLQLTRSTEQAAVEMREMEERSGEDTVAPSAGAPAHGDSLFQKKYVVPFVIACIVLACTQATGINSIMSYGARILQGSGLSEGSAASNLQIVTGINVIVTFIGALLVDKVGRKILLTIGTAGLVVCLFSAGFTFNRFESKRVDVAEQVAKGISEDGKSLSIEVNDTALAKLDDGAAGQLSVAYRYEKDDGKPKVATQFSNLTPMLSIEAPLEKATETINGVASEYRYVKDLGKLEISKAVIAPDDGSAPVDVTLLARKLVSPDGRGLKMPAAPAELASLARNVPNPGELEQMAIRLAALDKGQRYVLNVTCKFEQGAEQTATASSTDPVKLTVSHPEVKKWEVKDGRKLEVIRVTDAGKLTVVNASYGPIASPATGKWITLLLSVFIAFFALGPGVCVWLALTELMPTRIRSMGMSIAMFFNTGVQFLSALFFPIVVGSKGFHVMFFIWGGCTVVYFITAAFFMPETKGKTLEEIEDYFAGKAKAKA